MIAVWFWQQLNGNWHQVRCPWFFTTKCFPEGWCPGPLYIVCCSHRLCALHGFFCTMSPARQVHFSFRISSNWFYPNQQMYILHTAHFWRIRFKIVSYCLYQELLPYLKCACSIKITMYRTVYTAKLHVFMSVTNDEMYWLSSVERIVYIEGITCTQMRSTSNIHNMLLSVC